MAHIEKENTCRRWELAGVEEAEAPIAAADRNIRIIKPGAAKASPMPVKNSDIWLTRKGPNLIIKLPQPACTAKATVEMMPT